MMSSSHYSGIRFVDESERARFCIEMGLFDLIDAPTTPIPDNVLDLFYEERYKTVTMIKDFRKRQRTKKGWRTSRFGYMKGIKKFHRSIAGKKMHRRVGRQLSTKIGRGKSATAGQAIKDRDRERAEVFAWCKSLTSLRQHAFLLVENYMDRNRDDRCDRNS